VDLTASFQLTTREFRSGIRNSGGVRRAMIIGLMLTGLGIIQLLTRSHSAWLLWCGLAVPVVMEAVIHMASRKSAALFADPWTVRLTDQRYSLKTAASNADVDWSVYREANDRRGFWYLRQTNGATAFFPKRAFDETEQAELAEFFARRLPPQKKRWYSPRTW
jgi:hypothetical protein